MNGLHGLQALRQVLARGNFERDACVADLALGPRQALGHRRFRHYKRPCQLRRIEAAQRAQDQRHLRLRAQRRVAAGEDQTQQVVIRGVFGKRRAVVVQPIVF